jgi:ATP-dependent Clp protease protease subunit
MAGDSIYMPKNSMMMIHNCWTYECGNAKDLRKTADDLDKIMEASIESYLAKVKIDRDELVELLDNESWLTAQECFDKGFCTEILPISDDIEQSASKSIMDLVQENKKLKMSIQEPNQITFTEETIEKIAEKITERINSNTTKQELNKKVEEDSKNKNFFESFFNGILKNESEEK